MSSVILSSYDTGLLGLLHQLLQEFKHFLWGHFLFFP